jgi:hypothetical protein
LALSETNDTYSPELAQVAQDFVASILHFEPVDRRALQYSTPVVQVVVPQGNLDA